MKVAKAFTLLEVIMAVTITAVILMVVASGFSLAMRVYKRVKGGKSLQVYDFVEEVTRDLNSVYLYDDAVSLAFKGGPDSITFVTAVPLRYDFRYSNDCGLRKVRYHLVTKGNKNSVYKSSFLFSEGELSKEIVKKKFIDSLELLKFSYYNGKKWLSVWNSYQELPRAVRIWVKLKSHSGSAYDTFTTTVDILCR